VLEEPAAGVGQLLAADDEAWARQNLLGPLSVQCYVDGDHSCLLSVHFA
jgi:hypothetical protein